MNTLSAPITLETIENAVFRDVSHNVQLQLRWDGDTVLLEFLYVPQQYRGAGLAEAALERICELTDLMGWNLRLQPSDGFGSNKARLVRWYARHGFIPDGQPSWVSEIDWMTRAANRL